MTTHTIHCPECGVVLNVPESAGGRKLKCPKCETKFAAPRFGPGDSIIAEPAGPSSSMYPSRREGPSSGDFDFPPRTASSGSIELPVPPTPRKKPGAASSGSVELPVTPTARKKPGAPSSGSIDLPTPSPRKGGSSGSIDLPMAAGPLRETFDLPLLGEDLPTPKASTKKPAAADDALALFQDEPKTNRKPTGAEARSKARRCRDCGGVVPVGMSLCGTCGLDLDTGKRVAPLDLIDDDMPVAHRAEAPAMGVLFVGSLAIMLNVVLAIVSLIASAKQGSGMLCLMVIWLFGIYASVQFLRRKSIRPMFLALGLAAAIGAVYMIALPIYDANIGGDASAPFVADPNDFEGPAIRNLAQQIDLSRISWGVAMLLGYAALSIYLNTPSIKREFAKR
jgi:hypothetical protein